MITIGPATGRRSRGQNWLLAASIAAMLGLAVVALRWALPGRGGFIALPFPVQLGMVAAGTAILALARRIGRDAGRSGVRGWVVVLGVAVAVYPLIIAVADARAGGDVVLTVAVLWHVPALTALQLIPLLGSELAIGRRLRPWHVLILGLGLITVAGALLDPVWTSSTPSSETASTASTVTSLLGLGAFLVGPCVTWAVVRRATGPARQRGVVAAIAALVPVLVITLCTTLGLAAERADLGEMFAINVLMLGFSTSAALCVAMVLGAVGDGDHSVVGPTGVLRLLSGLLIGSTGLIGLSTGLLIESAGLGFAASVGITVVTTMLISWGAWRMHRSAARAVDPVSELQRELGLSGGMQVDDPHRSLERALRRLLDDPGLALLVRSPDGPWLGSGGDEIEPSDGESVALDGTAAKAPTARVVCSRPEAALRAARLPDLSSLLRPVVLEVAANARRDLARREAARADAAAVNERARLLRNVHDGLQGRLLGIALNLHLGSRTLADPSARLLTEETVAALRAAVDDVRALAGGDLPTALAVGGLRPALADFVAPLGAAVTLDLPAERFEPDVEATGYFVIAEALTNAVKHGAADQIHVRVTRSAGAVGHASVQILVTDNGTGGADPRLGSGLRGLAERVRSSGGLLVVRDAVPHGTAVEASLPCRS